MALAGSTPLGQAWEHSPHTPVPMPSGKDYDAAVTLADASKVGEVLLTWGIGALIDDRAAEAIEVFRVTKLDKVFDLHADLQGALKSYG